MSFKITIIETRDVTRTVGKDWKIIGQKPALSVSAPAVIDEYGYTPEIEKTVKESREILTQTVDELDLPAVIKAINKL